MHKQALAENECAAICHGVLLGLDFLHQSNRIHRDIKGEFLSFSSMLRLRSAIHGFFSY